MVCGSLHYGDSTHFGTLVVNSGFLRYNFLPVFLIIKTLETEYVSSTGSYMDCPELK